MKLRVFIAMLSLGVLLGRPARLRPPLLPPGPPPTGPARSRTSTSPARTASARRATRRSKVWFTVADGVLSDVYYPTIDNTNVETLQYVVTDGSTFTDLQTRDMTYTVAPLDGGGMACRVTTTAKSGKYRIVTDYVTDPRPEHGADAGARSSRSRRGRTTTLYVRFDPTINGNGGGGTGNGGADTGDDRHARPATRPRRRTTPVTTTNAANRDYAQPVYTALDGAVPAGHQRLRRRSPATA